MHNETRELRELSLFTGAGGGLLGTLLLGFRPIGYVEFNDYCQRVIAQRIADGILPNAPIFGDIRTFLSEGYAASYMGLVDCITGGFPCQPFSQAGKKRGANDARNMWPETRDTIRIVRPKYCLLENVADLITYQYFGTILNELAESGYHVRWRVLSAAEVGASHRRDRVWIMAHSTSIKGDGVQTDISSQVLRQGLRKLKFGGQGNGKSDGTGHSPRWPISESWVCRESDGIPNRVDRLKAIGNGQVPAVVRAAWHLLTQDLP